MKKVAKRSFSTSILAAAMVFVAVFCSLICGAFSSPVSASAAGDVIAVENYDVEATVRSDRSVVFKEKITVRFLTDDTTMFYRSLPVDGGDRYFNVWAKCEGNSAFSYHVKDNPDLDGFIDINCVGGVGYGKTWTYELGYVMLPSAGGEKDMSLDVIGYGWSVPLSDVDVRVYFPGAVTEFTVYSGGYGATSGGYVSQAAISEDKKAIALHADRLPVTYNDRYDENMAAGITVAFSCTAGALKSVASTRVTDSVWAVVIVGVLALAGAVALSLACRSKKEIVRVVSLKAPNDMDPLKMGRLIDGSVDAEDVTSMIYWFASKGYLKIDLTDERDPLLYRTEKNLPEDAPSYQRVLLNGLFKDGNDVRVSDLKNKFYTSVDKAKQLVSAKDIPHYEKKSVAGVFACGAIAACLCLLLPMVIGLIQIGGGYAYFSGGLVSVVAVLIVSVLLKVNVDRRYKTKGKGFLLAAIGVALVFTLAYAFLLNPHVISVAERFILCAFVWAIVFFGAGTLSHTERYATVLGEILGFKDFIVYTEEDKIKFMLEENPELYYDILPYAQVLGVTDEWEGKFKGILLEPPQWASGDFTFFDYLVLRSCMRSATVALLSRPQERGGSFIGQSGGGGGFGGFAGGGHGGGGGGAR